MTSNNDFDSIAQEWTLFAMTFNIRVLSGDHTLL
jgi:hypothetical protein